MLEGSYSYSSPGTNDVCALYLIGLVNQLVEVEFTDFNVACEDGGLLAVSNGLNVAINACLP